MAVRNTWASTVSHYNISYRFFTDSQGLEPRQLDELNEERALYNDLEFTPTKRGMWFTHRYLHAMFWAYKHYDFQFFLKTDDDYFICLNHLVHDLRYRRQEQFLLWGWLHCQYPRIVYIDEGFLAVKVDIVKEIIKRNKTLSCHPYGDQMIAIWMNELEYEDDIPIRYFADNERLIHDRAYLKPSPDKNLCKNYLGIHQSYPNYMYHYWNLTKDSWFSFRPDEFKEVERKQFKDYCHVAPVLDWRAFGPLWRHEPKPCWEPGVKWEKLEGKSTWHQGRE